MLDLCLWYKLQIFFRKSFVLLFLPPHPISGVAPWFCHHSSYCCSSILFLMSLSLLCMPPTYIQTLSSSREGSCYINFYIFSTWYSGNSCAMVSMLTVWTCSGAQSSHANLCLYVLVHVVLATWNFPVLLSRSENFTCCSRLICATSPLKAVLISLMWSFLPLKSFILWSVFWSFLCDLFPLLLSFPDPGTQAAKKE